MLANILVHAYLLTACSVQGVQQVAGLDELRTNIKRTLSRLQEVQHQRHKSEAQKQQQEQQAGYAELVTSVAQVRHVINTALSYLGLAQLRICKLKNLNGTSKLAVQSMSHMLSRPANTGMQSGC